MNRGFERSVSREAYGHARNRGGSKGVKPISCVPKFTDSINWDTSLLVSTRVKTGRVDGKIPKNCGEEEEVMCLRRAVESDLQER